MGASLSGPSARVVLPLMVGVLGIIAALSAACFVKAFGVPFLGRARSERAANAEEVPFPMQAALILLAMACLGLGLWPFAVMSSVVQVAESLAGGTVTAAELDFFKVMPWLGAGILLFVALRTLFTKARRVTVTWGCGLPTLTPRMQYTASAFTKPIRMVFAQVYQPHRTVEVLPVDQPYFPQAISYRSERTTSFERGLYRPAVDMVIALAQRLRQLQTGNIQVYLLYIFLTLVALLFFLRFQK
jgi:hydrogenase-4 component B